MNVLTRRMRIGLIWLACLGVLVSVAYAEKAYVQSKSAPLWAGKTSLSQTVATVQFGQEREVLRKEEPWLEVRTSDGVTGWVSANRTSATQPSGGESLFAKAGQTFRQTEAAPVTASAGARGLDKVSEEYANRSSIPKQYQDTVDRMAAYRIPDPEVEGFLKDGRLGEYAQ